MDEKAEVYCDIRELAEMSGLCEKTIRNWIYAGKLLPIKGHTGLLFRSPRRNCYVFTPAHLQQVIAMRNAMHWTKPSI